MRSGSKKKRVRPPELAAWQQRAIDKVAASPIGREVVFGGGAALAALHLHHRTSEDLDFFMDRELEPAELAPLAASIATATLATELEVVGPRTSLILLRRSRHVGRIDFAFYPFDPVGKRKMWRGLVVESLEDMTVNKLQAVLTRNQPRDFVDLYFLLREGPLRNLDALLDLARAKFDVGPHRLGLATRLLLVREVSELPHDQARRADGNDRILRGARTRARAIGLITVAPCRGRTEVIRQMMRQLIIGSLSSHALESEDAWEDISDPRLWKKAGGIARVIKNLGTSNADVTESCARKRKGHHA